MEVATRYADSDGVSIAYQVHGEGPIELVFVPGFVSHVELLWEAPEAARFLRRLASFSRLVVFDKRGQGLSDRPGRPPTLEESMDDLRAVIEAGAGVGRRGRRRPLGAEPRGRSGVRTVVGPAPAPGDQSGRGDRPDRPVSRNRRAADPADDPGADPGSAPWE